MESIPTQTLMFLNAWLAALRRGLPRAMKRVALSAASTDLPPTAGVAGDGVGAAHLSAVNFRKWDKPPVGILVDEMDRK